MKVILLFLLGLGMASAANLHLQNLGITGCTKSKPCDMCQGDCDNDHDCKLGYRCQQRDDLTNIAGCKVGGSGDVKGYDYCSPHPNAKKNDKPLKAIGVNSCTKNNKCTQCQGDCDSDNDCASGTYCFQRGDATKIPTCMTGGAGDTNGWDYCAAYEGLGQHSKVLQSIHISGAPFPHKLMTCQGDCDRDSDCGSGLICFQRSGYTTVPGCLKGQRDVDDKNSWDYCIVDPKNALQCPTCKLHNGHIIMSSQANMNHVNMDHSCSHDGSSCKCKC